MINRRDIFINIILSAILGYSFSNKVHAKKNQTLNKKTVCIKVVAILLSSL